MSRFVVLAALAAALLIPGAAQAATTTKLRGVVVAREGARNVLVVASTGGKVTSARVSARQLRTTRVGSRLAFAATKLADGSVRATRVHRLGRSKQARLRVTVVRARGSRLLVTGGGTAFAIRLTRGTRVLAGVGSGLRPGDRIETRVALDKHGARGEDVHSVGQSVLIDFSGTVTALDATSLTISSHDISTVVAIPDGVTLPALVQTGSEVEVVASVSGSTLTLVEVKLDGDNNGSGDGGGSNVSGDAQVEVEGFVTALDPGSVTIQPGDNASPVTFAIPAGFSLPGGLAAGSEVRAEGQDASGVLTLSRIELQNNDGGQTEVETEGTVTALDSSSITVQPADNGTAITFAIPEGFSLPNGLQAGSLVDAKGESDGGVLTLTKLELQDSGGGGGDGGGD